MVDEAIFRWREAGSTPAWCAFMKHTLARKAFKRQLGQANHYLVTTLVALDCLDVNPNHKAVGLHAAWSPRNVGISVQRSRIFAMHSFLGTSVDALDVYFSLLNRKPDFLQDKEFSEKVQACERSVYKKATTFANWVPKIEVEAALVETLITWRNNTMHELGDNKIMQHSKDIIQGEAEKISDNYCNLDPTNLCKKAESGADLTFKETASLIRAAHKFVETTDTYILQKLDKSALFAGVLREQLENNSDNLGFRTRLFDVKSKRWSSFISNWAGNTFNSPPLEEEDLLAISKLIPSLKKKDV